jgi:hypothetical protein
VTVEQERPAVVRAKRLVHAFTEEKPVIEDRDPGLVAARDGAVDVGDRHLTPYDFTTEDTGDTGEKIGRFLRDLRDFCGEFELRSPSSTGLRGGAYFVC